MISIKFDDSSFQEWVEYTRGEFLTMVQTLINVAEMIDLNTRPLTPVETERLRKSFKYVVTEKTSDFIEVELGYDAVDPESGFMYAEYQHETTGLHHPRGGDAFYLFKGIKRSLGDAFDMIEMDYLSLFGGRL